MSWSENVLTQLSAQGHRMTEPRRAILERIVRYTQPFSAEQLFKDLGGDTGPIGRATVYRTVDLLLNDHWLARVHSPPIAAFHRHTRRARPSSRSISTRSVFPHRRMAACR